MKNTLPGLLMAGLLLALTPLVSGAEKAVGLEGGGFVPSDTTFREFFKEGITEGVSFHLRTRQGFGLLFLADYYTQTRTFQRENFRVTSYPVSLQMMYYLDESPRLSPFLAVGVSGLWAGEENVTTGRHIGLSAKVGLGGSAGVEFGPRYWRVRPYFRWSCVTIPGQVAVQGLNLSGYTIVVGANLNFGQPKKPAQPSP